MGVPTYEIIKKKRSIIDFALTDSEELVNKFEILQQNFGVNPQSCHKVLKISIGLRCEVTPTIPPDRLNFNSIGGKSVLYFS